MKVITQLLRKLIRVVYLRKDDMKIYVAASYPRKADARKVAEILAKAGHIIIAARWIYEDEGYDSDTHRGETKKRQYDRLSNAAIRDIEDVKSCDTLVCLTDGEVQLTHGGRHSELGMALLLEKDVFIVGPREQVFHYHPRVRHYNELNDLLQLLVVGI